MLSSSSSSLVFSASPRFLRCERGRGRRHSTRFASQKNETRKLSSSSVFVVASSSSSSSSTMDKKRQQLQSAVTSILLSATIFFTAPLASHARLEGVNNPKLLPDGPASENLVIDAPIVFNRQPGRLRVSLRENSQFHACISLQIFHSSLQPFHLSGG